MNSIDHGDVSRHTGTHSSPEVSVQRAPILTNHPSRSITLPSPEFFGSIASGAHYAGALSPTHVEHSTGHLPHKRAPSLGADDPIVHETYQGVLEDVKEVRDLFVLVLGIKLITFEYSCSAPGRTWRYFSDDGARMRCSRIL